MSACYPRLGQNTPLVQKREKRKRDSPTNQHSTTAALHIHYTKTDSTPQSLCKEKKYRRAYENLARRMMRNSGEQRWVKAIGLAET